MKSIMKLGSSKVWVARFWAPVHRHQKDVYRYCSGPTRIGVYSDEDLAYLQAAYWLVRSWYGGRPFLLQSYLAPHVRAFQKHLDKGHCRAALGEWHRLMERLTGDAEYNDIYVDSTYIDIDYLYCAQVSKDYPFPELDHEPLVSK